MHLLVSVVGALLLAPLAASAQVIHACVKSGGTIKIVANPAQCGGGETPLSWNVQGPQGEPGTPGEPGIDGEPGAQGPPGPTLYVFDANGNVLGRSAYVASGDIQFFDEANAVMVSVSGAGTPLTFGITTHYETADCSGTPYFAAGTNLIAGVLYDSGPQRLLAIETQTPPMTVSISSNQDSNGECAQVQSHEMLVLLGRDVVLNPMFPLATPLYVGLLPE